VCRGELERSEPKIYVSRAVSGSQKNEYSGAQRGTGGRGAGAER